MCARSKECADSTRHSDGLTIPSILLTMLIGHSTPPPSLCVTPLVQSLEREIADFSKDRDKRVKAAQAKLKASKQVRRQSHCAGQHLERVQPGCGQDHSGYSVDKHHHAVIPGSEFGTRPLSHVSAFQCGSLASVSACVHLRYPCWRQPASAADKNAPCSLDWLSVSGAHVHNHSAIQALEAGGKAGQKPSLCVYRFC